jgi:hypothetical protein
MKKKTAKPAKAVKCRKCGGRKFARTCKLCELFATNQAPGGDQSAGWPRKSLALAVHPSEIAEFQADSKKMGVPTQFSPDGRPIFTSQSHQRDYCKKYNFVDRDSFI